MKKNTLYQICKIANWALPIIFLMYLTDGFTDVNYDTSKGLCGSIILIAYFVFVITRFRGKDTRSRWTYQIWIFLGYALAIYIVLKPESVIQIALFEKIIIVLFSILAILSKSVSMIFETNEYKMNADIRYENLLDEEVEFATYEYERAETIKDKKRAEMELERAKLARERYYRNKE